MSLNKVKDVLLEDIEEYRTNAAGAPGNAEREYWQAKQHALEAVYKRILNEIHTDE
jgi:hypothetical protein